jgi:hypothetical protein
LLDGFDHSPFNGIGIITPWRIHRIGGDILSAGIRIKFQMFF